MKNAIIIHGTPGKEEYYSDYPSASNAHWLPWLQNELLRKDIHAITPEMFQCFMPDYKHWSNEFEKHAITLETILVGHSCGGGFIARWLSEHPEVKVGKVVLVAPWFDPFDSRKNNFFDFSIDKDCSSRTKGVTVVHSDNDMEDVQVSVKRLMNETSGITFKEFNGFGHFCESDLGGQAFPELLEEVLN